MWPALSRDVGAVLTALPAAGLVECVWQDPDGRIHDAITDEEGFPEHFPEHFPGTFPELIARLSGATAAALLPVDADARVPLCTAVMPDDDGVVRARWRTEPTPSDRE
ncbi:hypothetical protein [Streptomyces sp. NPDC003077]|uniref:hypothetical protein n=1 Tax=Streptomyces sp. NPDC003077 TaxID=3154443 RepID=UPI0033A0963A